MAIRQEAVVLGLTTMLLGYWLYGDLTTGSARRMSGGVGDAPEFTDYFSPGVDVALPPDGRSSDIARDLFSPPRDTAPLQTLALDEPPLEALTALRVPFAWGPRPRAMGAVLQASPAAEPVAGLFEGLALEDGSEIEAADFGSAGGGSDGNSALSGMGYAGATDIADELADLVADDPAVRIAGYRKLYDSIQIPGLKWGRIRNENRWTLDRRREDTVLFDEVDPETGKLLFPGVPAIEYERIRIKEFAFAETTANAVELEFVAFSDPLRSAEHDDALDFARICIGLRTEVPRALEIALEICTRVLAISDGDDVEATLLLGRIREAGFDFDGAFQIYQGLIADGYRSHAEIHVRLGDLVTRFRLFDQAEQHYRDALGVSSTSWLAHWRFGRFLLEHGRGDEALDHLADAERREPSGQAQAYQRVAIRTDHGRALLFLGRTSEALVAFKRALNADSLHPAALAGVVATASFLGTSEAREQADAAMGALGDELPEADFELALALGMARTADGDWENAKRELLTAASTDPFRAYAAYRALSWLAEVTGHPDEALGYVNQAFEGNPSDAWTLYQRGRQMFAAEDLVGAEANLRAALDLELNFTDALVAMAELKRALGEALAAERYYERALEVDPSRAVVHSRRGFNLFGLGDSVAAEASFTEALRRQPDLASARLGDAWARYVAGDSQEAITRLGELVEARRNAADDDPYRAWAQAQAERIVDHEEKEVWTDLFERR
ncbi:MAG: tetratricopeptide (TPR) repeat protein, partial [Planctomycetota bacterium]